MTEGQPNGAGKDAAMTQLGWNAGIHSLLKRTPPIIFLGAGAVERELPRLSLSIVATLCRSVGNNEAKAGMFTLMSPGSPKTETALYHVLVDNQVGEGWSGLSEATLGQWCEASFAQAGLVTVTTGPKGAKLYERNDTDLGYFAVAFAGRSLLFSEDHPDVSLSQLQAFRPLEKDTSTNALSGTLLKIRVLQELACVDNVISQKHLTEALFGEGHNNKILLNRLWWQLKSLEDAKLINIETKEKGKSYAKFALKEDRPTDDPPTLGHRATLQRQVYSVITPQGDTKHIVCPSPFTYDMVYRALCITYPEIRRFDALDAGLNARMSAVLNHLAREGYIENIGLSKDDQKRIWVPETSRKLFEEYAIMLEEFRNGDRAYYDESIRIGEEIVGKTSGNSERRLPLLAKAKATSHKVPKSPAEVTVIPADSGEEIEAASLDTPARPLAKRDVIVDITDDLRARILHGATIAITNETIQAVAEQYDIPVKTSGQILNILQQEDLAHQTRLWLPAESQHQENWEDAIHERGATPKQDVRKMIEQPPTLIANMLQIPEGALTSTINLSRYITVDPQVQPYLHDITYTYFPVRDSTPQIDLRKILTDTKTITREFAATPEEASMFSMKVGDILKRTFTIYFDGRKRPIAVKTHTIPKT